ncbi:MAG: hypothetical protein IPK03_11620 [Bacteroidetes bacterium]|nr:hypothetical protein [Bacteroidota bacterium]
MQYSIEIRKNLKKDSQNSGKNRKGFLKPFLFSIILMLIFFYCFGSLIIHVIETTNKASEKKLQKNGKYTIGKILYQGNLKGSYCIYEYIIGRQIYKGKRGCSYHIEEGEQYKLIYDSTHNQDNLLLLEYPIINQEQDFDTTYCEINSIDNTYVYYKYSIKGTEYFRSQKIKSLGKFTKGNKYILIYLATNPQIGYIENKFYSQSL